MEKSTENFVQLTNGENIYHNDYRSRNIILWDDDKTYVIDFGSAAEKPVHKKEKKDIGDALLTNRIKSL
jgi:serine/threonine-protein kinase RIO1